MKFCPVVPEICRGQVHGARKERRIIIIIIRNGAKTINLQTLFGRLNKWIWDYFGGETYIVLKRNLYKDTEWFWNTSIKYNWKVYILKTCMIPNKWVFLTIYISITINSLNSNKSVLNWRCTHENNLLLHSLIHTAMVPVHTYTLERSSSTKLQTSCSSLKSKKNLELYLFLR